MSRSRVLLLIVSMSLAVPAAPAQDDDFLYGINFVRGAETRTAVADDGGYETTDEIVGTVVETTNPYTNIPKPNGIMVGLVYEPDKDGKAPANTGSANMLTGISAIINAMNAASKSGNK
ncbi:MAG: hypothetical protein KC777_15475 [Cyanobacteria bacterium HKST-UBA02]|nr:hypothetical protein [Cyanobacteria bacterium HKST-UBA02]